MGSMVDVSQADMKRGAATWQQPGGQNFTGDFEKFKDMKPTCASHHSRITVQDGRSHAPNCCHACLTRHVLCTCSGRGRSKHQITSLVYDLAQKEGELAEKRGKGFQTKKQTWGKYGWA
eukprot:SAG11_NODE_3364_length_2497_cov_2.449124_2_plen_119_part_00